MKLPASVLFLGYVGLLPFLVNPLWWTLAPESVPVWLDALWLSYVAMIASFMAGSFWGFALPAAQGPEGQFGLLISVLLMILAWVSAALPFHAALPALAVVFLLLLLADVWRERTLGTVEGYFKLRSVLTLGVLGALAWRRLLTV